MLEVYTPKRISRDCPFKTVWQIQNVLTRIRIPLFKLMWIRIQIPTCLAKERKLFSSKSSPILRVGNFLIRSESNGSNHMSNCEQFAQINQDKWVTVSESLRSLMSNEQPWVNSSSRKWQMSDCEQFAQVAHDRWTNEQIALFSEQIAHLLFCSQKTSDALNKIWLKCFFWYVLCRFFEKNQWFAHFLFFTEW